MQYNKRKKNYKDSAANQSKSEAKYTPGTEGHRWTHPDGNKGRKTTKAGSKNKENQGRNLQNKTGSTLKEEQEENRKK